MCPMVNSWVMSGNPCHRDCPDREPGCNCQKKQDFNAQKEKRKAIIKDARDKDKLLNSYEKMSAIRKRKRRSDT